MFRFILCTVLGFLVLGDIAHAQELDFRQRYERGKLLYQRKLYADAISELKKASYTSRGRSHFGVYYYIALSYFNLPDIQKANQAIQTAKRLTKRALQRQAIKRLSSRIEVLYGKVRLIPEVDPDEVGRLRIVLKPKAAFSNKYKLRYFKLLQKRLQTAGVIPNSRVFYVPKGDYEVKIATPQCLRYGLFQSGAKLEELSVTDNSSQVKLKAARSCGCTGGQKMVSSGKRVSCVCPAGTGWNTKKQRCEVGVNPVPWILAGVGVVVVSATAVVVGLVVAQNDGTDYRLLQNPGGTTGSKTKLWK